MTPQHLTEEDVRRIIREELKEVATRIVSDQTRRERARLLAGVELPHPHGRPSPPS